jgi:hypothetical protein
VFAEFINATLALNVVPRLAFFLKQKKVFLIEKCAMLLGVLYFLQRWRYNS